MSQHLDPVQLRTLPVAERLKLIEDLWDSIATDADTLPLPDWHRTEVDARLDALESGRSVGSPWQDVCRRITSEP